MKTRTIIIWFLIAMDIAAYFSVPPPDRLQWQYILPGGGFVALYQYSNK